MDSILIFMISFIILYNLCYKTRLLDAYAFLFENTISIFLISLGCCKYNQVKEKDLRNQRIIILSLNL